VEIIKIDGKNRKLLYILRAIMGCTGSKYTPRETTKKKNTHYIQEKHESDDTPLVIACLDRDITRVKTLLQQGNDVNEKDSNGWTALMYVSATLCSVDSYYGSNLVDVVILLLERGADTLIRNNDNQTALCLAIERKPSCGYSMATQNNSRIVKLLQEANMRLKV